MSEETNDCTRLSVVAWKVSLPTEPELGFWFSEEAEQYPRYQHHEPLCRLTDAQSLATDLRLELNAKRLKLCAALKERNDAQALLAQKDARIAQLAAHARGKNKALANALKEIERLKTISDNYCALLMDANQKLQAAPAERGVVVLPGELKAPSGGEWGSGFKRGYEAYSRELMHLNPSMQDGRTGEVITEHSGCGQGVQVDQLSVRMWPGDRVVMVRAKTGTAMSTPTGQEQPQ